MYSLEEQGLQLLIWSKLINRKFSLLVGIQHVFCHKIVKEAASVVVADEYFVSAYHDAVVVE